MVGAYQGIVYETRRLPQKIDWLIGLGLGLQY